MKIGYFVQGAADEAFVLGIVLKYCPDATFEKGVFRGSSHTSLRREIRKGLIGLNSKYCDYFIVLTDSDNESWRTVYNNEKTKIPDDLDHKTIFGVAERNIESWLALDKKTLSEELQCDICDIPTNDSVTGFLKNKFWKRSPEITRTDGKERIHELISKVSLYIWIKNSDSFEHFWNQIYDLSKPLPNCNIPNERERHK